MKKLYYFLLILSFSVTLTAQAYEKDKVYNITILHTNDLHGRFWPNEKGEYGLAAQKTLVDSIRAEVAKKKGYLLLLSSGDINTGVPESDMFYAEPDFIGMSIIGYDAMALGNHEFDNPYAILKQQQEWAGFPFLSANIFYKDSNKRPFKPYIIKDFDFLNIAILGLTTQSVGAYPNFPKNFTIESPLTVTQHLLPTLKNKADIILAITHIGLDEDKQLAAKSRGLNFILGGHSQEPIFKPIKINDTYITQSYEWGKYVGRLDLTFLNGKVTLVNYQLIPVNYETQTKSIKEDPALKALLTAYKEHSRETLGLPVAYSEEAYEGRREYILKQQMPLGKLIARAQAQSTQSEIGIVNGGSTRAGLPNGIITQRDLLMVLPFNSEIASVCLSDKDILTYMKKVALSPKGSGGYVYYSGMTLLYKNGKVESIQFDKQNTSSSCRKVSVNNYIAGGGDDYPVLTTHQSYKKTTVTEQSALRCYLYTHCGTVCEKEYKLKAISKPVGCVY